MVIMLQALEEKVRFYESIMKSLNGFLYVLNIDPYKVDWVSDSPLVEVVSGQSSKTVIQNGAFMPARLIAEPDFRESVIQAIDGFGQNPEISWGGVYRFKENRLEFGMPSYHL